MINLLYLDNDPKNGFGVACNFGAEVVNSLLPVAKELDFCFCKFECDYEEKAFVNLNDLSNGFENDKKDLLIQISDQNGSIDYYLLLSSGEEIPLIDDTLGTYYNFSNTTKGFVLDWSKVVQSYGHGTYKLKSSVNSFGKSEDFISYNYRTFNYSDQRADQTLVIKTFHSGYIENGIDYTNNNWTRYIRVEGELSDYNPIPEHTRYESTNRRSTQIQSRVVSEYSLKIRRVPQAVFDALFSDRLLANSIKVSDYNLFNPKQNIRDLDLEWVDNNGIDSFSMSRKIDLDIKMKEVDLSTIKRQY